MQALFASIGVPLLTTLLICIITVLIGVYTTRSSENRFRTAHKDTESKFFTSFQLSITEGIGQLENRLSMQISNLEMKTQKSIVIVEKSINKNIVIVEKSINAVDKDKVDWPEFANHQRENKESIARTHEGLEKHAVSNNDDFSDVRQDMAEVRENLIRLEERQKNKDNHA